MTSFHAHCYTSRKNQHTGTAAILHFCLKSVLLGRKDIKSNFARSLKCPFWLFQMLIVTCIFRICDNNKTAKLIFIVKTSQFLELWWIVEFSREHFLCRIQTFSRHREFHATDQYHTSDIDDFLMSRMHFDFCNYRVFQRTAIWIAPRNVYTVNHTRVCFILVVVANWW